MIYQVFLGLRIHSYPVLFIIDDRERQIYVLHKEARRKSDKSVIPMPG
ncbi:hypothetical protein HMPREF3293_00352 [Christensenella minuta]|uniref:Uncharacterized protein n=1 Tax=Christensenella minuta TaxID=626937 RepID=A0A136Q898_9FIRM|nr:hypothetical protein HMPREF3293_00352 [Christensenella minuta]